MEHECVGVWSKICKNDHDHSLLGKIERYNKGCA